MKWPLFKTAPKPVSRAARAIEPTPRYHAVEIVSGPEACEPSKKLRETRFLSSESPPVLPVSGCDRPERCTCRYRHHSDRRHDQRRSGGRVWESASPRSATQERRYLIGRRVTDWAEER